MITGKQRSYLKKLAHNLAPIVHIGKNGVTDTVIDQIDEILEIRELVKVKLLDASMLDAKITGNDIAGRLAAEFVQSIGGIFVIYRESIENKQIVLPKK